MATNEKREPKSDLLQMIVKQSRLPWYWFTTALTLVLLNIFLDRRAEQSASGHPAAACKRLRRLE